MFSVWSLATMAALFAIATYVAVKDLRNKENSRLRTAGNWVKHIFEVLMGA